MQAEATAGHRRYLNSTYGGQYQTLRAHLGEGDYSDPTLAERTLGDYLDPHRPGSTMQLCNAAARDVGQPVDTWPYARLVRLVATIQREAQQRQAQQ